MVILDDSHFEISFNVRSDVAGKYNLEFEEGAIEVTKEGS
jgi:hypothetical protein